MLKTIGFDAFAFRMQTYGGISKQFEEIINRINQGKYSNSIEAVITEHIPEVWQERLHAESIARDSSNKRIVNAGLRRLPRSQQHKLDLWHLTYYHKAPLVFPRTPFAITVHDFTPEIFPELMEQSNVHLKKMELINKASLIFCVSETTKQHLLHFFPRLPEDKIKIAYPGPSIEKTQRQISGARPYFLIVGRNDRYKNLEVILRAIPHFLEYDFIFFGLSKSEIPRKYLIQSGNQIFCMTGNSELLAMYYHGAEAYLNPTLSEGFCIPVLDALVSNCPTLVSDIKVFHELYGNSVGYFDPKNLESLIESIKHLNSIKLQPFNTEKFTWAKSVEVHVRSYLELLN